MTRPTIPVCIVEIDAVQIAGGAGKTFHLSDIGYDSLPTDPSGPICYLPFLDQPLQCDREMPISPESARMVGATWGDITIFNQRKADGTGYWDAIVPAYAVAGRGVRVKIGQKTYDATRGIWLDQSIASFVTIFSGVALNWVVNADEVNLRIRDNLAPLENPLQTSFYGGTGGAGGNDQVAGQPIPKLRGDVLNITPTLIDPTHLVYQISDTAISSVTAYDGGLALTSGTDYATYALLAAATVASGTFATSRANGLIRLGAAPTFAVTALATGASLTGSISDTPCEIAQDIITEDGGYAGTVDTTAFSNMDTANLYDAGFYSGANELSGVDFLTPLLASIQASVGTKLDGTVTIFQITPPESFAGTLKFTYTTAQILDCQPVDLDQSVIVPNWRRSLSYAPNDTVLTTMAGAVSNSRRQFLINAYSTVTSSNSAKTTWPTAEDAPLVASRLILKANAQTVVNAMLTLWGKQRFLYDVTLPLPLPLADGADLGTFGAITYPDGPLAASGTVLVVGHAVDVKANTITLRVLL